MTEWVQILPAVFAALVFMLIPGLVFGMTARFTGVRLAALAGPISIAFIAIASIVMPFAQLRWSPLNVALVTMALAVGLGYLFRRFGGGRAPSRGSVFSRTAIRDTAIVVAGGAVLSALVIYTVGAPSHFDQAFDNVFHLNAIRFVMDEGSASPLTLGRLTNPDAGYAFYPSGWHGLCALVAEAAGASVPFANNAVMIVLCLIVWPLGLLLLARRLFGEGLASAIGIAIFVPAFAVFPLHFLFFGPLLPMLLGVALLPAALAVTMELFDAVARDGFRFGWQIVLVLGILAGVGIAHPGVFMAWLVATDLLVLCWLFQGWRGFSKRQRLVFPAASVLFWIVSAALLWKLQPDDQASHWGPNLSPIRALSDLITAGMFRMSPAPLIAIFVIVGLVSLWVGRKTRPQNALLLAWFVGFGFLYFVAESQPHGTLRRIFIGAWYQDPHRLGMFAALGVMLAAVAGFVTVWRFLVQRTSGATLVVALIVLSLVGAANWLGPNVRTAIQRAQPLFVVGPKSQLISNDELALINRLQENVPEDAVIAGNPWQGAGMAYAFGDRKVLLPHMFVAPQKDRDLILNKLNSAEPGAPVCNALERQHVEYVLDFPGPSVLGKGHKYPGLEHLADSPALQLVDSEGKAKLYRITGC